MDSLHLIGIEIIQRLQLTFQGHDSEMSFLSHVGDPRNAFLVFFPLVIFTNSTAGVQVLWVSVISEWLNALLKWILHGERPYWWVQETALYSDGERPGLMQNRLTCETGPGSPSGHVMVISSVLFMISMSSHLRNMLKASNYSVPRMVLAFNCLVILPVLVMVSISRCFISAHFPHQVVAGAVSGYILAKGCNHLPVGDFKLKTYILSSILLLLSAPMVYRLLEMLGFDPVWSVALATKWCARPEWVYLDTTLFFAIVRDSASLLGLGLALAVKDKSGENMLETMPLKSRVLCVLLSLVITRGQEYIRIPHRNQWIFYFLSYLKYTLLPVVILIVIPRTLRMMGFAFPTSHEKKDHNS